MLTQLTTIKSRLVLDLDPTFDALLTRALLAISARFDQETNRVLQRTVDFQQEFDPSDQEIVARCYPIESVAKFEVKLSEAAGWLEQANVDYLIRQNCIVSLATPLLNLAPNGLGAQRPIARVTYTGGYLVPGSEPIPGAVSLPTELEHAAVEQTAFWFQTKDKLGVIRQWPKGGSYEQFADPDLLVSVREILRRHSRVVL